MSIFKVQRIRSCVTCGDVLALKCKACIKHPNRRLRILDFYDWPPIIKTAECGCCIQFRCQAEGCPKTRWAYTKHDRGGKAVAQKFFCSISCSALTLAKSRTMRQMVPCAWDQKLVEKKSFAIKTWKQSFCNRSCYFLWRAKEKHETKERAKLVEKALENIQSKKMVLQCNGKCNGSATNHIWLSKSEAQCQVCKTTRDSRIKIVT